MAKAICDFGGGILPDKGLGNMGARPLAHRIDTRARALVTTLLPDLWEFREKTGRDYGIDMEVEIFEKELETGGVLLFQIKGKEKLKASPHFILFSLPAKMLKYAELFTVPVLLVVVPVNEPEQGFYYCWLQEYIRVILNFERANWRQQRYVTVKIPTRNKMPGNESHLSFIAFYPHRLEQLLRLADCYIELNYLYRFRQTYRPKEWAQECLSHLQNLDSLRQLFSRADWGWSKRMKSELLVPIVERCNALLEGPCQATHIEEFCIRQLSPFLSALNISFHASFEAGWRRDLWEKYGDHDF